MLSNVPKACSPKECIGNSMKQHIGIGVSFEPSLKRDLYATDNKFSPHHQAVDVIPEADAEWRADSYRISK